MFMNQYALAEKIGKRLRERRRLVGWSQAQLAVRCTVRRATISEIENGKVLADIYTIYKLYSELGISLNLI